jgi:hypothetical protein
VPATEIAGTWRIQGDWAQRFCCSSHEAKSM